MSYSSTFFDAIVTESLASAKVVVPLVVDLVCPTSVVDVGCATGAWLSVFRDYGISNIAGLDGAYAKSTRLLIPSDCFRPVDLRKPFCLSERFDLAMSLEVAEHLPAASAGGFVRSLCQLAPIILFSAAVPGQTGVHHVNEQWPEYWRGLFASQSFRMFDPFRPVLWHDERVAAWYRQNMFLFVQNDILKTDLRFSGLPEVKDANALMVVDPNILLSVRATVKRFPSMLWVRIMHHIRRLGLKKTGSDETRRESRKAAP
jgi:hypothetical protein